MFRCMYIPHFAYLCVDGNLGYVHLLAIANNAAANTGYTNVCSSPLLSILWGRIPIKAELVDHMVILVYLF